jgi:Sec7-like guanine-nucleotide exchange factor
MYSRHCELDKIAEVIGGKDEQSKRVLEAYLSLQDFAESKIQDSLRSFL